MMNRVGFQPVAPAHTSARQAVEPQFQGFFNKDEARQKADEFERNARHKGGPDKMMKAGAGMMALTLLPGPQQLVGPLGAVTLGAGWLWKKMKEGKY